MIVFNIIGSIFYILLMVIVLSDAKCRKVPRGGIIIVFIPLFISVVNLVSIIYGWR